MKGRPIKSGDGGHGDHLSAAKAASMKGRPLKSGDVGAGAHGTRVHPASMKGRPIQSGDLNPPSGIGNGYAPR